GRVRAGRDQAAEGWGGFAVAGEGLPPPRRPSLVDAGAWGPGPLCRRRDCDVLVAATGRGRPRAADRIVDRPRVGTQGGEDSHRAPERRWGRRGFPRFSPPAGARLGKNREQAGHLPG